VWLLLRRCGASKPRAVGHEGRQMQPLVRFDSSYYKYPTSICRGYWGRYPLDMDLSVEDRERRAEWLDNARRLSGTPFHEHVLSRYGGAADYSLFTGVLQTHGIFAERFFHSAVRHRILAEMVADPKELESLKTLKDSAWGYDSPFGRKGSVGVFFVVDHLFEQHLLRAIADRDAYSALARWYGLRSSPRRCAICGSSYRLIDLPDWAYAGSNGTHVCCLQCPIVERPSKNALLPHVREFAQACGFVPFANAVPLNHSFTCRLSPEQWPSVFVAYGKMGGVDHVKAKWTSWFRALASSGVLPDGVMATSRGVRCLAKDGHECRSLDEQRIDDWLTAHSLPHEREPLYPTHPVLNPRGKRRADWLVGDVYLEYFGLTGEKAYDKKTDEKVVLAAQLGTTMVPVYPSDMMSLDEALRRLLTQT